MKTFAVFAFAALLASCSSDTLDIKGRWMNLEGNIIVLEDNGKARVAQEGLEGGQDATWTLGTDTLHLIVGVPEEGQVWNEYRLRVTSDTLYLVDVARHEEGRVEVLGSDDMAYRMGRPPERMHFIRYGGRK